MAAIALATPVSLLLTFAAVNCGRSLRTALGPLMITLAMAAHAQSPAPSSARQDLLRDLAGRIAAATGTADPIALTTIGLGGAREALVPPIDADLAASLRARGVRVVTSAAPS